MDGFRITPLLSFSLDDFGAGGESLVRVSELRRVSTVGVVPFMDGGSGPGGIVSTTVRTIESGE